MRFSEEYCFAMAYYITLDIHKGEDDDMKEKIDEVYQSCSISSLVKITKSKYYNGKAINALPVDIGYQVRRLFIIFQTAQNKSQMKAKIKEMFPEFMLERDALDIFLNGVDSISNNATDLLQLFMFGNKKLKEIGEIDDDVLGTIMFFLTFFVMNDIFSNKLNETNFNDLKDYLEKEAERLVSEIYLAVQDNDFNEYKDLFSECKSISERIMENESFYNNKIFGQKFKLFIKGLFESVNLNYDAFMGNRLDDCSVKKMLFSENNTIYSSVALGFYYQTYKNRNTDDAYYSILFCRVIFHLLERYATLTEMYYYDNPDTDFSEAIETLTDKLKLTNEIEFLKSQIKIYEEQKARFIKAIEEERKDNEKEADKQYKSELRSVKEELEKTKKALAHEKKKDTELNKLREFMFQIENEYVPEEVNINLSDLIKGKRIVIVGGHENWRRKIKEQYPSLILIDGHTESFDIRILSNASFILLFTGNMNHGVYYKVMNEIRSKNIPFDYLGKTTNMELIEKELVDTLYKAFK